jgi:endoglucanase
MNTRATCARAVVEAAEKPRFAWCYWQFDGDFNVSDIERDRWIAPIRRALAPLEK